MPAGDKKRSRGIYIRLRHAKSHEFYDYEGHLVETSEFAEHERGDIGWFSDDIYKTSMHFTIMRLARSAISAMRKPQTSRRAPIMKHEDQRHAHRHIVSANFVLTQSLQVSPLNATPYLVTHTTLTHFAVAHEITHIMHGAHSAEFYAYLDVVMDDYDEMKRTGEVRGLDKVSCERSAREPLPY